MNPRLYHFTIRNERTGESISFLGQGDKLDDAFKDGVKNCGDTFRPKNDGRQRPPNSCAVTLKNGQRVSRTFSEWDSDKPYTESRIEELEEI